MTSSTLSRSFALALCSFMVVSSAADRIDPRLKSLATTQDRLHVLIFLTQQPQLEIVSQLEGDAKAEKDAARSRLAQALSEPFRLSEDVNAARADLERINLTTRRTAMAEIQRAIQPQQDRMILLLRSYGVANFRPYTVTNAISAEIPSSMLPALEEDADVAHVSAPTRLQPQLRYSVPDIFAPTFWADFSQGTGESVGVLDTGIDSANPGFNGVAITGHISLAQAVQDPCFGDDASTVNDLHGHGTHVSGIVASHGGGSCTTCIGVAPGIQTLYALKIGYLVSSANGCPGGGESWDDDVIAAIDWALGLTDKTINVFNYSYGGSTSADDDYDSLVLDQIGDVNGVNIVIAAGNAGYNPNNGTIESPGISYNGLTVGSVDDQGTTVRTDDVVSGFSSRGPTAGGRFKPDISAPGNHGGSAGAILSTCINGGYCQMAGTSMATPHVAGALALIRSAGAPDGLSAKAILLNSTDSQSGWNSNTGWGFVNMSEAATEVSHEISDSVTAAGPKFYEGTANGATLKTTLVWNRHVSSGLTSFFSNLDLSAYDGASGSLLGSSTSTLQNVEQVVAQNVNTVVLSVMPTSIAQISPKTNEPYALAISAAGFAAKNGPAFTVACTGPSGSVNPSATFSAPCTVTNTGDLTAFSISGTLNWQGSSGGTANQFGNAGAGQQTGAQSWQMTAPASTGQYTLEADVSSTSYGQTFTGSTTVSVMVAAAPTYTLTTAVSPSNAGSIVPSPPPTSGSYAAGTQVCLTATPNAGWAFSSWSGATLDSSNCLLMNANASVTANFTATAEFADVPSTNGFFNAINLLFEEGITTGCVQSSSPQSRMYCPGESVTRGQMAAMIVRAVTGELTPSLYNQQPYFQDVPSSNPWYPYVQKLMEMGITVGCSQSPLLYCPNATVPRWEMAIFMMRARLALYGASFSSSTTPYFSDVPTNAQGGSFPFIQRAYEENVTTGCGQNPLIFCPNQAVTRGQMAAFVMRALFNQTMLIGPSTPYLAAGTANVVSATPGSQVPVTIMGVNTNFRHGDTVTVPSAMLTVSNVLVNSTTSISATLTVNQNAVPGPQALVVTTGGLNLTWPLAIRLGTY